MRFLTPIIGRLQSGLFNPMIHRVIRILGEQGLLPEIPGILKGKNNRVMYLGRLALAMKTLETEGLQKTLADWAPLAQAEQLDWIDNLDMDESFRESARNNGMPATWLKDIERVKEIRQERAKAMQMQQMAQMAPDITKSVKNLSGEINDKSPIRELQNVA